MKISCDKTFCFVTRKWVLIYQRDLKILSISEVHQNLTNVRLCIGLLRIEAKNDHTDLFFSFYEIITK